MKQCSSQITTQDFKNSAQVFATYYPTLRLLLKLSLHIKKKKELVIGITHDDDFDSFYITQGY